MKVWVIMSNDFPDSAHASEEAAEKYVAAKKAEHEAACDDRRIGPRVYWRAYEFVVQGDSKLAEAEYLIRELCAHEGAEGHSQYLNEKLEAYQFETEEKK